MLTKLHKTVKTTKITVLFFAIVFFSLFSACNKQTAPAEKKEIQDENYKPYIRTIEKQGAKVELDLTTQVLALDIPVIETNNTDEFLYSSLSEIKSDIKFISTSMVIAKLKQFDDGLYAAIELKLQEGSKNFIGKKVLLKKVKNILENNKELCKYEIEFIENAVKLGEGEELDLKKLEEQYKVLNGFLYPLGFYTWSSELENIFKQDALLQKELQSNSVKNFQVIFKDDTIKKNYSTYTGFIQKLTNPFPEYNYDLRKEKLEFNDLNKYFFFPKCGSNEAELFTSKYKYRLPPENYSLMDDLIESVKNGSISLEPKANSGWYDYKQYSLEPFLISDSLPEAKSLKFSDRYKKELVELFKGALALARETHIKNLARDITTSARITKTICIYPTPDIKFEPTMTFYKRSAGVYSFVRETLLTLFTLEELKELKRISPSNDIQINLYDELQNMEDLLYGIYYLTAHSIGTEIEYSHNSVQVEILKTNAVKWADNIKSDPDVGTDNRMMVPVYHNIPKKKFKVWMFLGYTSKKLNITYEKQPAFKTESPDKETSVSVRFSEESHDLYTPVFEEVYVDSLLNRNEFREICDKLKTRYNIKKYLGESKYDVDKYKNKLKEMGINEIDVYQGKLSTICFKDTTLILNKEKWPVLKIDTEYPIFKDYSKLGKEYISAWAEEGRSIRVGSGTSAKKYLLNDYIELGSIQDANGQIKSYLGKIIKIAYNCDITFELINNYQRVKYKFYSQKFEIVE